MLVTYTWIDKDKRTPACFRKDIQNTTALTTLDYFAQQLTTLRINSNKKHLPMWSPCLYLGRKTKEHTISVEMLVFDIDDGTRLEALQEFEDLQYIAHTSYSHIPEYPKWRLILPLKKAIPANHWRYAWEVGAKLWRERTKSKIDPSCKNANRFYFVLGCPKERSHFARVAYNRDGELLDLQYKIPKKKKIIVFNQEERSKQEKSTLSREDRISLASSLGGVIAHDRAVKIPCPKCGRRSMWYWLDPTNMKTARCNHQNSCGYYCYPSQLK